LILAVAALPARAEEPARPGNAAIHYWCAAAAMKRPANDQEQKVLDYIEQWEFLPPKVFIENRDCVRFLEEDLRSGAAMDMLHIGAACAQCDFDVAAMNREAFPPMTILRHLEIRASAVATMLEGQGQLERAAEVHGDAVQFSVHLCQCPALMYALTGIGVLRGSLGGMNDFLVRKPGKEPVRALMVRLISMPSRPLSFSACIADDARRAPLRLKLEKLFSDAELDEALQVMDNNLPGQGMAYKMFPGLAASRKMLIGQLRSLKPDERAPAYGKWADQVGEELSELAKAGEGRFADAGPRVKARIEHMKELATPAAGQMYPENPLVGTFAYSEMALATFAGNNARLAMSKILLAAAFYEAETGQYPTSLENLSRYFPQGLPKDPFTESDFEYKVEEGLPAVAAHPPEDVRREYAPRDFRISMAEIIKNQSDRLERYRKEVQNPAPGAHD